MKHIEDCPFINVTPEKGEGIIYVYSFDDYVGGDKKNVCACARGKRKHCNGFQWRYMG